MKSTKSKQSKQSTKSNSNSNSIPIPINKRQSRRNLKGKKKTSLKDSNKKGGTMSGFVASYYVAEDDDTRYKKPDLNRCMCLNFSGTGVEPVRRCNNKVVSGTHFCSQHMDCPQRLSKYVSGSEPAYAPSNWGDKFIEGSHNCYSYFLDSRVQAVKEKCEHSCKDSNNKDCPNNNSECTDLKPQPGDYNLLKTTGSTYEENPIYRCPAMEKKILMDNDVLIPVAFNKKCPKNYFKGAMVVDPDHTFHFYRQDKGGMWSHKPGISPVSNIDASDRPIYIPHLADRNYARDKSNNLEDDSINYTDFCGYYCIPENSYMNKNLA
jgi:hypothetical protein